MALSEFESPLPHMSRGEDGRCGRGRVSSSSFRISGSHRRLRFLTAWTTSFRIYHILFLSLYSGDPLPGFRESFRRLRVFGVDLATPSRLEKLCPGKVVLRFFRLRAKKSLQPHFPSSPQGESWRVFKLFVFSPFLPSSFHFSAGHPSYTFPLFLSLAK